MSRPATADIDFSALKFNLERVRSLAPKSRVVSVVKANAYGHGIVRTAQALADSDVLAVACIEEAVVLRNAGIPNSILLLEGTLSLDEMTLAGQLQLQIVVHHEAQLEFLDACDCPTPFIIWLKIDTGMHRLGFSPDEVASVRQRLEQCAAVAEIRDMTHLACADERGSAHTQSQLDQFAQVTKDSSSESSIANSAGILAWPQSHADWVRPGLMLYGVSPFPETTGIDEGLRPVMTLSSALIAVNRCRKGDTVGYGADWVCPQDMPVGVVAIGYGDGYPRHAPNGTPVLVDGRNATLIGRVSMDMITVDLRACPDAQTGDLVQLWGPALPVESIAQSADTIPWDLLCGVTQRVEYKEHG